jgi:hypothetical protein
VAALETSPAPAAAATAASAAKPKTKPGPAAKPEKPAGGGEVVRLDRFRKK